MEQTTKIHVTRELELERCFPQGRENILSISSEPPPIHSASNANATTMILDAKELDIFLQSIEPGQRSGFWFKFKVTKAQPCPGPPPGKARHGLTYRLRTPTNAGSLKLGQNHCNGVRV